MAKGTNLNRLTTRPLGVPRTRRSHSVTTLTSLPAGKCVPVAAIPLLREDGIRSGRMRLSFEMSETAELLMNAVNVRVMAYFVPTLAFERFNGSMDILNRSYMGKPPLEGEDVIPFVRTEAFGAHGSNKVYQYLGVHAKPDRAVNSAYLEAYNAIFNYRATLRSKDLEHRSPDDGSLAPAFWGHERFRHIVADVDLASIDGQVPLNIVGSQLALSQAAAPVKRVGGGNQFISETGGVGGSLIPQSGGTVNWSGGLSGGVAIDVRDGTLEADLDGVFAEMADNGITVSLSNLEMAKKVAAFARLRQQFAGHDDEWIIDLLMSGISIPDQALKQPMLLAERKTVFGLNKRYASDAENLTESAVNGSTYVDLSIRLPRITTGGVVMVIAEITPDQLFERQADPYLFATEVEDFPEYLRDETDPEFVSIVKKEYIDVDHDDASDHFGFQPGNAEWFYDRPRIGGRFYRPEVDAGFDEDRMRIWAVETKNPTLSEDFFLATQMHAKPFLHPEAVDHFECVAVGSVLIEGNTKFGPGLIEAGDDYDKVMAKVPMDRIDKPVPEEEEEEEE